MYFLLPFKGIGEAKTRWSKLGGRRHELVLELLSENLQTVVGAAGSENVFLVTPDPGSLKRFPTYQGILTRGDGLNQDLSEALAQLQADRAPDAVCVLLPDLPGLTAAEVDRLLRSVDSSDVALCPDESDHGTNALVVRDWDSMEFLFEGASFQRHLQSYQASQLECSIIRSEGLAQDCDSVDDLERFWLL